VATLLDHVAALLGISAYQPPGHGFGPSIDSKTVEDARRAMGGLLQQQPVTQLRWYLADLEEAQAQADAGYLSRAAQLYRAMARDGTLSGLLSTRTAGLVRLPKRFYGSNPEIVQALEARNGSRSVFDEMFPPSEVTAIEADGDVLGVGVGELCPVEGRDYPVLVRLDPEFLQYVWTENRWYYISRVGRIPITPGDGRWVLHIPGGRIAPWRWGMWPALGRSFINKEHAIATRASLIASVANPARVIESAQGATEQQRKAFFGHVARWGPNTVLELPVGWQAKILELTGRSYEVFQAEIDTCDRDYMVAVAGQIVTTTGGAGFQNSDVQRVIRSDLIKASAENLAYTLNTQGIPLFVLTRYGEAALEAGTSVEWDTSQPKDLEAEARTIQGLADGLLKMSQALMGTGREVDVDRLFARFGVPLKDAPQNNVRQLPTGKPSANAAATPEGQERAAEVLKEAA
jgi:hypothetical protein